MRVDLIKEDLVNMILGITPQYAIMGQLQKQGFGSYCGGHVEKWEWHSGKLAELNEGDLLNLYNYLKISEGKSVIIPI